MNLAAFLDDYARSAEALPTILSRWSRTPVDSQMEIEDELIHFLGRRMEALELLRDACDASNLMRVIKADQKLLGLSREISRLMGIEVGTYLHDRRASAEPSEAHSLVEARADGLSSFAA